MVSQLAAFGKRLALESSAAWGDNVPTMKKFMPPFMAFLVSSVALAAPSPLNCTLRSGEQMQVNNEQVLQWKKTSATEFVRSRAHITGSVVKQLPPLKSSARRFEREPDKFLKLHQRYEVQIGPNKNDVVELFYNGRYEPRPALQAGDKVEACGEFVADATSSSKGGPVAIVYWVHAAKMYPHVEGFLHSNGKTFGREVAASD